MMKLYVKPGCGWCADAIGWLRARDYQFEQVDVLADRAAFDRMRKISGQTLTPTIELRDGTVLPDFDTGQLEQFMRQQGLQR